MKLNKITIYICAIMRNESSYLEEWLNFHTLLGIDGFILYDNNIDKTERKLTLEICKKFNNIILINWDKYNNKSSFCGISFNHSNIFGKYVKKYGKNKQQHAYDNALKLCKKKNIDYLLKIDIDEFLLGDLNILKKKLEIKNKSSYRINRINFGSNFHITKPKGSVIENYIRREINISNYKDIANVKKNYSSGTSSHRWISLAEYYLILINIIFAIIFISILLSKNNKKYQFNSIITIIWLLITKNIKNKLSNSYKIISFMRLNHYITKSKEEFLSKDDCAITNKKNLKSFKQKNCNHILDKSAIKLFNKINNK